MSGWRVGRASKLGLFAYYYCEICVFTSLLVYGILLEQSEWVSDNSCPVPESFLAGKSPFEEVSVLRFALLCFVFCLLFGKGSCVSQTGFKFDR